MSWLLAKIYDRFMLRSEQACLADWRRQLLAPLEGDVLEVGAGTGANLGHYGEGVGRLVLAEPDRHMLSRLARKVDASGRGAELLAEGVGALPLDAGSFDVVVSTLVLCSVDSLPGALADVRRVLRPGGRLVFIEHVAADEPSDRLKWQQRLEPVWVRLASGCHLTRRTDLAMEHAGFELATLTRESMRKALPFIRPTVRGVAVRH